MANSGYQFLNHVTGLQHPNSLPFGIGSLTSRVLSCSINLPHPTSRSISLPKITLTVMGTQTTIPARPASANPLPLGTAHIVRDPLPHITMLLCHTLWLIRVAHGSEGAGQQGGSDVGFHRGSTGRLLGWHFGVPGPRKHEGTGIGDQ